jgi:hypothetical protein
LPEFGEDPEKAKVRSASEIEALDRRELCFFVGAATARERFFNGEI